MEPSTRLHSSTRRLPPPPSKPVEMSVAAAETNSGAATNAGGVRAQSTRTRTLPSLGARSTSMRSENPLVLAEKKASKTSEDGKTDDAKARVEAENESQSSLPRRHTNLVHSPVSSRASSVISVISDADSTLEDDLSKVRQHVHKRRSLNRNSLRRSSVFADSSKLKLLLKQQDNLSHRVDEFQNEVSFDATSLKDELYAQIKELREENRHLREQLDELKHQTTEEIAMRNEVEREASKLIECLFSDDSNEDVEITEEVIAKLAGSLRMVMFQRDEAHRQCVEAESLQALAEKRLSDYVKAEKTQSSERQLYAELHEWHEKRAKELKTTVTNLKNELLQAQLTISASEAAYNRISAESEEYKNKLEKAEAALETLQDDPMTQEASSSPRRTTRVWDDDKMTFIEVKRTNEDPSYKEAAYLIEQRDEAISLLRLKDKEIEELQRRLEDALLDRADSSATTIRSSQSFAIDHEMKEICSSLERQLESAKKQQMAIEDDFLNSQKQKLQLEQMLKHQQEELVQQQLALRTFRKEKDMLMPMDASECYHVLLASQHESRSYFYAAHTLRHFVDLVLEKSNDPELTTKAAHALNDIDQDALDQRYPVGWEAKVTEAGLVYYVNHNEKYSTWINPMFLAEFAGSQAATEQKTPSIQGFRPSKSVKNSRSNRRSRKAPKSADGSTVDALDLSSDSMGSNKTKHRNSWRNLRHRSKKYQLSSVGEPVFN